MCTSLWKDLDYDLSILRLYSLLEFQQSRCLDISRQIRKGRIEQDPAVPIPCRQSFQFQSLLLLLLVKYLPILAILQSLPHPIYRHIVQELRQVHSLREQSWASTIPGSYTRDDE